MVNQFLSFTVVMLQKPTTYLDKWDFSLKDFSESSINELTDTYTFVARNTNKAGVYVTYNTPAYVFENGGLTLLIELLISTLAGAFFGISAVFFKKGVKRLVITHTK